MTDPTPPMLADLPLFDLVMGVAVPTLVTGSDDQREALAEAQAS